MIFGPRDRVITLFSGPFLFVSYFFSIFGLFHITVDAVFFNAALELIVFSQESQRAISKISRALVRTHLVAPFVIFYLLPRAMSSHRAAFSSLPRPSLSLSFSLCSIYPNVERTCTYVHYLSCRHTSSRSNHLYAEFRSNHIS